MAGHHKNMLGGNYLMGLNIQNIFKTIKCAFHINMKIILENGKTEFGTLPGYIFGL